MIKREVAWRVFAGEYNLSSHKLAGVEERAPSYLVSPLGAMMNRVFVSGVLTDMENIGTEEEPMWRARVSDPTGVFYLSAGQYQPEASMVLAKLTPPTYVAVIGKVRTYTTDDGTIYVSIRPEAVKEVDEGARDYWVLETCRSLRGRLDAMREALRMDPPKPEELRALGYGQALADGIVTALEHYGEPSMEMFYGMLRDSLDYVISGKGGDVGSSAGRPAPPPEVTRAREPVEAQGKEPAGGPGEGLEEQVMSIIGALDKDKDGASWEDILELAEEKGIDKDSVEEAVASLSDKGMIYEPILGRVKKI